MGLNDIQKTLTDFSTQLDLVDQAKKSCAKVIPDLIAEDNGSLEKTTRGFEPSELIYEFNNQALIFNSYLTDTPSVRTQIGIYIKDKGNVWVRGLEPVGKYVLETNLEGEDIDDWLDFDKTKKEVTERDLGQANGR